MMLRTYKSLQSIISTDGTKHDVNDINGQVSHRPNIEDYPSSRRLGVIVSMLCVLGFMISLDSTVMATAALAVTSEFDSLADVGWYSSAYFLTMCVPQLAFMKVYARYPTRWVYSGALIAFLAGSILCGTAASSSAFIAGRALAGLGAAGLYSGNNVLVPYLSPPKKRPLLFGLFLAGMSLGQGSGPLIGGVFTEKLTWRWNFYVNLPIGVLLLIIFWVAVHPPARRGNSADGESTSFWEFFKSLDPTGIFLLTVCVTCLLVALQKGGMAYPWNDARIIAILSISGVSGASLAVNEIWQGHNALLPTYMVSSQRTIGAMCVCMLSNGATSVVNYYLPIWFQGVRGDTPIQSGIHTLPLVIGMGIASIVLGAVISRWQHFRLFMLLGCTIFSIGSGLLSGLHLGASSIAGQLIGYQILIAGGSAAGKLCPATYLQSVLQTSDLAHGLTVLTFLASLGGAVFVSVAQAIFATFLPSDLRSLGHGGVDHAGGVTDAGLQVVNEALSRIWYLSLALGCASLAAALAMFGGRVR